jgi:hypothetical protein
VVVRYRNRRHNRRHNRRRNQGEGFLRGNVGAVVGVLGGAALTKVITGFLPSNLTTGYLGWLTTGVVAVAQGQIVGRAFRQRQLGNWLTVGGLVVLGLQIINQFIPTLGLPFTLAPSTPGTSGMGLITSSNFYVPQVNLPGSMASFVTPAGIPVPVVVPKTAMSGIGATGTSTMNSGLRRIGRLR